MIKNLLLLAMVIVNIWYVLFFIKDLKKHPDFMQEKASSKGLPFTSFLIFFLSTFGISDFAIGTAIYKKLNWVSMKDLPGTLNATCALPATTMALCYISGIKVGVGTLLTCIICQTLGAYIGPAFAVKLPEKVLKMVVAIGLVIASILILLGQFNVIPSNGNLTALSGWKLVLAGVALFVYGALNNVGIGCYAPTMVTIYLLGMNPIVAFPIMMGGCGFSLPVGSMQFIKLNAYSRKVTLFTMIFGVMGVFVAVFVVKSLNTYMLKWLVMLVLVYTAISLLLTKKD
ncbi:MAG: sulfite exporter TauE/SafE family protein [Lactobacillus sp.]|nr:sulfite exporter TauE/SafE family protein [Lactobacillus sp.]